MNFRLTRPFRQPLVGRVPWLVLTSLLCVAAHAATGAPGMIDACRYADDAAAQAAWRPMAGTAVCRATVTSDGRAALRLPCNFAGKRIDRASWDRQGRVDLSDCSGIRFELRCPDFSPVSQFSIYFQSGDGWYAASFSPESTSEWNTITIDKADTETEGKPAGWAEIRTVRISAWCGGNTDTEILLSNITKVGVLGGDAQVAILRADSVAKTRPDEVRSVQQYTESMAQVLASLGIAHATLSDLDASGERLSKASVVILPHNPNIPEAALDALAGYLDKGGKLMAFYGLPPRLAALVKIQQGRYVGQDHAGQFAAMRFVPDALPGAPPVVGQRSWNIVEPVPVAGASRVLAEWLDDQGRATGHAAIVGSSNGIVMSHVLLMDDLSNKQRMLLAMIGRFVPGVWEKAAADASGRIGRINGYQGFEDAVARIAASREGDPRVADSLGAARRMRAEALDLAVKKRFAESCDKSAGAAQKMMDAFCYAQRPLAGEFRGFWCHSASGVDGMTWDEAVKRLADNGFTAVFPNMMWGGAAFYQSEVLPRAAEVATRGDQIALCLAACRKYGIACHVWKVNWNLGDNAPAGFARKMRAAGRLQMDARGGEGLWLCPSHPDNRKLEIDSMVEVARNYGIDGLHFDYIRYPDADHCFCPGCRQRFEQSLGTPLAAWPKDVLSGGTSRDAWLDWRRSNITAVVKAVREQVRAIKPKMQLSAAVFSNWPRDRDGIGQDWKLWCEQGYLDFVCPMDYTASSAHFENLVKSQKAWAGRVPCYPGIGVSATASKLGADGVIEQIQITRRQQMRGFMIFNLGPSEVCDLVPMLGKGITAKP